MKAMHATFLPAFITSILLLIIALPALAMSPSVIRWNGVTEIALGRGEKGPWQQNDSRYDYVDDPTVAFDAAGATSVAWVEQQARDVFFQKFSPGGVLARHAGQCVQ